MPRIELVTEISAPIERVFDLARSIDVHAESQRRHGERAVAGRMSGLIEAGEEVTWEAVHFGIRQRLTSRIDTMNRPRHFRDSMVRGAFRRFVHDHYFDAAPNGTTVMRDVFAYEAPLGPVGRLVDWLFLRAYMQRLLSERNAVIRRIAESGSATLASPGRSA